MLETREISDFLAAVAETLAETVAETLAETVAETVASKEDETHMSNQAEFKINVIEIYINQDIIN